MAKPHVAQRWRDLADQLGIDKPERFTRLLAPWDEDRSLVTRHERAVWLEAAFRAVEATADPEQMPQFSDALDALLVGKAHVEGWAAVDPKRTEPRIRAEYRALLDLRASVARYRQVREQIRQTTDPRHVGPARYLDDPTVAPELLDAVWRQLEPVTALPRAAGTATGWSAGPAGPISGP